MGKRLVRAKLRTRDAGIPFRIPEQEELPERLQAVLDAIYAAYSKGWNEVGEAGVPVVQSTDGKPYQPMFAFWQMLARRDGLTGETLSTPKQRLTRAEALRMAAKVG